jgi:REP element-mobilizing transposase RayT
MFDYPQFPLISSPHINNRYNWLCHTYCLMDNHYHLLIETPDGNLAPGMHQLNGVYTRLFKNILGSVL